MNRKHHEQEEGKCDYCHKPFKLSTTYHITKEFEQKKYFYVSRRYCENMVVCDTCYSRYARNNTLVIKGYRKSKYSSVEEKQIARKKIQRECYYRKKKVINDLQKKQLLMSPEELLALVKSKMSKETK